MPEGEQVSGSNGNPTPPTRTDLLLLDTLFSGPYMKISTAAPLEEAARKKSRLTTQSSKSFSQRSLKRLGLSPEHLLAANEGCVSSKMPFRW